MNTLKEIAGSDLDAMLLKERTRDSKKIEEEVEQLADIYQTVYEQIRSQGKIIDDIEDNIEESVGQTTQASSELKSAEYYKNRSRIWGAIAMIGGVAVATLGIAIIKRK